MCVVEDMSGGARMSFVYEYSTWLFMSVSIQSGHHVLIRNNSINQQE